MYEYEHGKVVIRVYVSVDTITGLICIKYIFYVFIGIKCIYIFTFLIFALLYLLVN